MYTERIYRGIPRPVMARKLNRILQSIRDILLLLLTVVVFSTSWNKWQEEPAHIILMGIASMMALLALTNLILVIVNVKSRGYYYFFTIFTSLPLVLMSFSPLIFFAVIPLILNLAILFTLRNKE